MFCFFFFQSSVALQFPEGLLLYACTIADILERYFKPIPTKLLKLYLLFVHINCLIHFICWKDCKKKQLIIISLWMDCKPAVYPLTACLSITGICQLTKWFHIAVYLFSNSVSLMVLQRFNVFHDLLLYRPIAMQCNLFVLCDNKAKCYQWWRQVNCMHLSYNSSY